MILKLLREGLGRVIVFFDSVTRPKKIQRDQKEQQLVEDEAKKLSLYQIYACPFCVRTRRAIHHLNIPVTYRDAQNNPEYKNELISQGGRFKTPCLRIEENNKTRWMYESKDIIAYLNDRFDDTRERN